MKNRTYYFFDDIFIKNLDWSNIKLNEISYKNILMYHVRSHPFCTYAKFCVRTKWMTS